MAPPTDVACFGELLWDFFEAESKADKEPFPRTFRREVGGASANLAVTLARLGVKTSAIGGVGEDKLGDAMKAALGAEGVEASHVVRVPGARTGITFVTRDAGGEPSFLPYRGADLTLPAAKVTSAMAKASFCAVGTTSMLPSLRPATEKFLAAAQKAKAIVVVDMNVHAHLWPDADAMGEAARELVSRAAIVKASERDLGAIARKRGMSWLEEHAGGATWVLTRGENGAGALGPHGQVTAPTKRVRCVDATGAGDAFLSGVLALLVRSGAKPGSADWKDGRLWTRALEVGHLLAAKAVSAVGAVTGLVQLDDIRTRIDGARKG